MEEQLFGDKKFHYSHTPIGKVKVSMEDRRITDEFIHLVEKYNEKAKQRVELTKKRWNSQLSEMLKIATGFKLSHGKRNAFSNLDVQVVTALPPDLLTVFRNTNKIVWELLMRSPQLLIAKESVDFVKSRYEDIAIVLGGSRETYEEAGLTGTQFFLRDILDTLKLKETSLKLGALGIDETLGAYFFWKGTIELYWPAIAFYSSQLQIPIEDLTYIVLAHEKAHAMTHLGFDLDGKQWDTSKFAGTDSRIVEGLAQFYTEQMCKTNGMLPNAQSNFERLLKDQPLAYRCFKDWLNNDKDKEESVRRGLLVTRRTGLAKYSEFLASLTESKIHQHPISSSYKSLLDDL